MFTCFYAVIHHIQFSYFEFSVILYSGARILNAHIKTHLYVHKAYHINYNTHHGTSQPRNIHVLWFRGDQIKRMLRRKESMQVCSTTYNTNNWILYFLQIFVHRIYISRWENSCSCNYSLKDAKVFFAYRRANSFLRWQIISVNYTNISMKEIFKVGYT